VSLPNQRLNVLVRSFILHLSGLQAQGFPPSACHPDPFSVFGGLGAIACFPSLHPLLESPNASAPPIMLDVDTLPVRFILTQPPPSSGL